MGRISKSYKNTVISNKNVLAIIPARGGSKRLPNKNILDIGGKPMISWTIEASLKSKYIDQVYVSSEDENIIQISTNSGSKIIKRPEILANDEASTLSVLNHAISKIDTQFEYIILLQPTSPLRNHVHIDEALELIIKEKANAVISVCKTNHSPQWSNMLPENGNMDNFIDQKIKDKRSQDLDQYYRINGAIYIYKINELIDQQTLFLNKKTFAYVMERNCSVDIDTRIDFELCSILLTSNLI